MTEDTDHRTDELPLDRAVALAREYDGLMGLSYVALGLGFLYAAVTDQPAIGIALGAAFSALAVTWYVRRFGGVKPRSGRATRLFAGAMIAVVVILIGYLLDRWLSPPVSLSVLAVALVLGGGQFLTLRRIGLTPIHWIVYGLLVIAAFGPLLGLGVGGLFSTYALTVTGVALVVVGIVDHRRLAEMMGPTPEQSE
jgi:hypothetical protein